MDWGLSMGPGEGIVNPVKGVGGVEDRLVSGDIDIVLLGSAKAGPPSSSEVIVSIIQGDRQPTRRDAFMKRCPPKKYFKTHTTHTSKSKPNLG